jgi:hypothetical protein
MYKVLNVMKVIIVFLLLSLQAFAPPLPASNSTRIKNAFTHGDSKGISAMLLPNTELVIESEQVHYNHINAKRAQVVLEAFFKKNPPTQFNYQYKGNSSDIEYFTANYVSFKERYWVYIILSKTAGKMGIGSIHFKKES